MRLLGISGAARSGKDTVGEHIDLEHNFKRYAFADPLKKSAHEMFGIPLKEFYEGDREKVNEFWGFSPRQILQLIGTECGRQVFRDDIWVKRAEMEWKLHQDTVQNFNGGGWVDGPYGEAGMVITDVRFVNEAQWVHDMGGTVIHVTRPGADGVVGVEAHASEAGYPDSLKDIIIENDGTLDDLYLKVDKVMSILEDDVA